MSSKNKTPLGLSQWEGTEVPERLDFNSDNLLTDWALMERVKKVENAKAGNFAVLTKEGGIGDSGKSAGDFKAELAKKANQEWVESSMATKANNKDLENRLLQYTTRQEYQTVLAWAQAQNIGATCMAVSNDPMIAAPDAPSATEMFYTVMKGQANRRYVLAYEYFTENPVIHYRYTDFNGWRGGWLHVATATPPQEFDLALATGWSKQQKTVYFKNQFGEVTVIVTIVATANHVDGTVFATLPVGYRPSSHVEVPAIFKSPTTTGTMIVHDSGGIGFWTPGGVATGQMLFSTITFVATN